MKKIYVKKVYKKLFAMSVILIGILVLLLSLDNKLRPLLKMMSETRSKSVATKIVNNTVTSELKRSGITYENLVDLQRDSQGVVTSLNMDMVKLNQFKSNISTAVQDAINKCEKQKISLPLGTVIGGDYFVGRGPALKFDLELSASVTSEIESAFDSAGINQTRHQIILNITTTTYAVIPWYKNANTVTTNFVIAETVIVGLVPDYYTNVENSDDPLGDVNDYGAEVN